MELFSFKKITFTEKNKNIFFIPSCIYEKALRPSIAKKGCL